MRAGTGVWNSNSTGFELQRRGFRLPIAGLLSQMGENDDIVSNIYTEHKVSWLSGRSHGETIAHCGFDSLTAMMFCHILSIA